MDKKILINARHPEEKRVAIVEGETLTDFYIEVPSAEHVQGNIYKGVIKALDPGLQAAFVNFGPPKDGFLPLRDVMPENYHKKATTRYPAIKDVLAKGQEILVQVEHDQRGTKGASLTNRVSLPGRYLVMIPGKEQFGISRKIEDQSARDRLREAFKGLRVPKGMGFILRTAGAGRSTEDLAADLKYLTKLWNKITRESKKASGASLIYKEEDIAVRTVRDYLTEDVTEVLVDDAATARTVRNFLKLTMPTSTTLVTYYKDKKPLFELYDLEEQIARLNDRQVFLPSGGSIVIDKTEALTAIDVNSGRSKKDKGIEALALRTNLEAADEAARQLRLRDIGGLVAIDFIDMEIKRNYREVEERLSRGMDQDKAHYEIARISKFGILEMSRERMRSAYFDVSQRECPSCAGAGVLRSPELVAVSALREIHSRLSRGTIEHIACRLPVESANYLLNRLRDNLAAIEDEFKLRIVILADSTVPYGEYALDVEGEEPEKKAQPAAKAKKARRGRKRSGRKQADGEQEQPAAEAQAKTDEASEAPLQQAEQAEAPAKKKRTRRGRRRSPKKTAEQVSPASDTAPAPSEEPSTEPKTTEAQEPSPPAKKKRSRRKRAAKKATTEAPKEQATPSEPSPAGEQTAPPEPAVEQQSAGPQEQATEVKKKRTRRRRSAKKTTQAPTEPSSSEKQAPAPAATDEVAAEGEVKKKRSRRSRAKRTEQKKASEEPTTEDSPEA